MKIIEVFNETKVCCKGNDLGDHPLVFLSLDGVDEVKCPYCSIVYKKIKSH